MEEALVRCQQIGYPIMLKASWGGGGKGIRKVHSDDDVRAVFKQIQGEVRMDIVLTRGQQQACVKQRELKEHNQEDLELLPTWA